VEDCTGQAALHRRNTIRDTHAVAALLESQVAGRRSRGARGGLAGAQVVFQGCRLPARVYLSRLSVRHLLLCAAFPAQHPLPLPIVCPSTSVLAPNSTAP
jgi:hypothetical protein